MDRQEKKQTIFMIVGIVIVILIFIGASFGIGALYKEYKVWSREKDGQASLAEAEWSKKIAVEEAKAKLDSAKLEALAEVERAKGVAEANKIIGDSLKNNDAYLRYLWINGLHDGNSEIIYVPTEANLPILEAGRNF
jgi:hypothetical protein